MSVKPAAAGIHFPVTVPVLVIGSGACGLTAALAAHDAGAEVLVLERDRMPRGSTALSSGFIPAAGTRFQREKGIEDSPALLAADIMAKNKGRSSPIVTARVAERVGPTLEWLADRHGVKFEVIEGFLYPSHSVLRMHATPQRTGADLMTYLLAAAEAAGIATMASAHVVALFAEEDGRIAGVEIARPDGARETIGCAALVLACNGYGGDPALVRRYIPEMAGALYFGHQGNQGDALRWGEALGARLRDLGAYQGHGSVAHPHGILITWALMMEGGFQVNAEGRRFSNEQRGYSEQAVDVLNQQGGVAIEIYDARLHALGLDFEDYRNAVAAGAIRSAESIEALAVLFGLPAPALAATLAETRATAAGERTDPFGRDFTRKPTLAPPFYGVRVTGALFHTQGGLEIDADARVLRRDGRPLLNLLAGGGASRGLSGPERAGYFSGGGLLAAVTIGRIAGETASRLAGSARVEA
ncbi:MAG TPA: FAD-dependent oxidoreductase [Stellaceae bacterium]|jgi:fumarate reductase flavoprotein subunit|nr:FAD-dependent oxidoreductase [Stellaceae bacterium]